MKALLQRVTRGSVSIRGAAVSSIGHGLVVFLGVARGDSEKDAAYLAEKLVNLRIFADEQGKMNLSLLDTGGELLVVSQFTLYGDCRKGRRPSFDAAAPPAIAQELYEKFIACCRAAGVRTANGQFQAEMIVKLDNHGPVTMLLDSSRLF